MTKYDFDLFVIGGGSGGVRCARIAAGHGARVGVAEERFWGGTCVNVGCVPKKLMVMAAEYGHAVEDSHGFGWDTAPGHHDWSKLIAAKDAEIARLNGIYRKLMAGCTTFDARATADRPPHARGGRQARHRRAHRHRHWRPPGRAAIPRRASSASSPTRVFHLPAMPKHVTIIGGGYIAMEFAGIFAGLGAQVDLVIRQHLPLRGFDEDLREGLAEALETQGITLHRGNHRRPRRSRWRRPARSIWPTAPSSRPTWSSPPSAACPTRTASASTNAGVTLDGFGAVCVDEKLQTSQPGIYAIGDVTNRINLTPVAIAEGHCLADSLFGPGPRIWNLDTVASAVFSTPPIATVGLTEDQAAAQGPVDIYLTRFTPMRHTLSRRPRKTIMKLVVDQESQRILGAHMLGEDAAEIMQGLSIAINAGATKADFDRTVGIHPTAAEEFVTMRTRTRVAGVSAQTTVAA